MIMHQYMYCKMLLKLSFWCVTTYILYIWSDCLIRARKNELVMNRISIVTIAPKWRKKMSCCVTFFTFFLASFHPRPLQVSVLAIVCFYIISSHFLCICMIYECIHWFIHRDKSSKANYKSQTCIMTINSL